MLRLPGERRRGRGLGGRHICASDRFLADLFGVADPAYVE